MPKLLLVLLFTGLCGLACAQDTPGDENVILSNVKREFRFVKGNAAHPVQVKEETRRVYNCRSFRTEVPVAEFYNDMETIDDLEIRVDGSRNTGGIKPKYDYYEADGVFYSDSRVCHFSLPLVKKGTNSETVFKKITLDPRYFTNIFFIDDLPVAEQEVKLVVPSWIQLEIKEYNFSKYAIRKNVSQSGDETVYTYQMQNIPFFKQENYAPGITHVAPHILVLCKSAQPGSQRFTYFETVKEQYEWYRSLVLQIGDDEGFIKEKTEEIIKGLTKEEDKVKKIFQWVQDNVRYIAFENGIAGFKPEKSQEVLRKKYGDCKGMANLLTVMLRSIKLDARRCWIGTRSIVYDYSTPSLSVDNHMICAWMNKGIPVYLDATEKYIGFGEIAERIQGRQTLIENGNEYSLAKVPVATPLQNTSTESRLLSVEGNDLKGHVIQVWRGENKEWLLTNLSSIKQDKQENALKQYLAEGMTNFDISNLKIGNLSDYNADLKVEYDVYWKDALTRFDKDIYLEIDNRRNFHGFKIDTSKRKLPFWFHFKDNIIQETEIKLPVGWTVSSLPAPVRVNQPGYSFVASCTSLAGKLLYKNEIKINKAELDPADFGSWNKHISELTEFYDQQIVLSDKK